MPIVKRNPFIHSLYDNLPVIKVDDWSEVNRNNLQRFTGWIITQKFDFNSLFLQHWVAKIKGKEYNPLPKMHTFEFREFLTANYC